MPVAMTALGVPACRPFFPGPPSATPALATSVQATVSPDFPVRESGAAPLSLVSTPLPRCPPNPRRRSGTAPVGPGSYDTSTVAANKYRAAPSPSFGGQLARVDRAKTGSLAEAFRAADLPAPGAYNSPSSMGKQTVSRLRSSERMSFGSSSRDDVAKMTLADVKAASQSNPDSPGPGNYSPVDSMTRRLSPSFAFGGNLGKMDRATTGALAQSLRSSSPGPGHYKANSSVGSQSLSGRPTASRTAMPRGPRYDTSAKPDLPASGSATEGPGFTYTGQVSAFSTQASSTARTATRSPLTSRPKQDVYVTLSGSLIYRTSMGTSDGEHSLAEGEVHRAERASSRRSRTASFSFGGGQRLSKEPASAAAELGPMYDVKPTGRQSPQYSFGKQQREPEALREARRKAVPGPGQYKSASGFGGQWVSTRPTSSFATLGRSSRDVGSKLYASKADMRGGADPNTAARGAGTPGPGQYAPNVSPVSSKRTSPQFSFGGRGITRGERSVIVGEAAPGSYHSAGSLGRQSSSRNRSAPRTTFGRASRDNAGRVSQPGVRPAAVKSTPGPGNYTGAAVGALGAQSVSTRRSYIGNRFGRSQRLDTAAAGTRGQMPGPGNYGTPSSVGRQASSRARSSPGFKFGTSQRASPDEY